MMRPVGGGWLSDTCSQGRAVNLESGEDPLWKPGFYRFYLGNPEGLVLLGVLVLGPVGGPPNPPGSREDAGRLVQEVLLLFGAAGAHAAPDDVQQRLEQLQDQGVLGLLGHQHLNQVQDLWQDGWAQCGVGGDRAGRRRRRSGWFSAHPDLEVPPERLLLLQLVLLVPPGLDAQLLLSKEAGEVLVQRHHGLVPQLLIVIVIDSTLSDRCPVSSLASGHMHTDRDGSLRAFAHQRLPCLQHGHQLLPEAGVDVPVAILLITLLLFTLVLTL